MPPVVEAVVAAADAIVVDMAVGTAAAVVGIARIWAARVSECLSKIPSSKILPPPALLVSTAYPTSWPLQTSS